MKNSGWSRPIVGLITLLVIFSILCLTILSVLSLSTAKYEKKLAQKSTDSVAAYYKADVWCTDVSNRLYALWQSGGDLKAEVEKYGGSYQNGVIAYARRIDGQRILSVTISVKDDFSVTGWRTVSGADWQADEHIKVWDGQTGG